MKIKSYFSIDYLLKFWERDYENEKCDLKKSYIGQILNKVKEKTELLGKIEDMSIIDNNRFLIDELMSIIFTKSLNHQELITILVPFTDRAIYISPAFAEVMEREKIISANHSSEKDILVFYRILNKFYGFELPLEYSTIGKTIDKKSGLEKYYKLVFDYQFSDIDCIGELPKLNENIKSRILESTDSLTELKNEINLDAFEVKGFIIIRAFDVTQEEVLSDIKRLILERNSLMHEENFVEVRDKLRAYFGIHDLFVNISFMREQEIVIINFDERIKEHGGISNGAININVNELLFETIEKVYMKKEIYYVHDLRTLNRKSRFEDEMIKHGKINILIAPLVRGKKVIGALGIASIRAGEMYSHKSRSLTNILPIFASALQKSLDDFEENVQETIREKFTSIHPAVHWKFRKTVINFIRHEENLRLGPENLESIVFEKVYPLYAVSDIRGSSSFRNSAIQEDLIEQLRLAKKIIDSSRKYKNLPLLDELAYRIEQNIKIVSEKLDSGDEIRVVTFIKFEVEQFFEDMASFSDETEQLIVEYRSSYNSESGSFYNKRKDFDESVEKINKTISGYLDKIQIEAQEMFPHYFDKQITDGVDQSMYIGESMVENLHFDRFYLKNLRLWQFLSVINIARLSERVKPELKMKLDTTHLIVVQDMPLTIRFDLDEKKFRVDGTYNIRYEIMKKRIDKAEIKISHERITKPGHIAIVYTQTSEATEYFQYIEYLQARGYLEKSYEEYELEEVQGIKGLRAIRVKVNLNNESEIENIKDELEFGK